MHVDLDEIIFAVIFLIFNAFMLSMVEGLMAKLFFLMWTIGVFCCAIYIVIKRDKKETDEP